MIDGRNPPVVIRGLSKGIAEIGELVSNCWNS